MAPAASAIGKQISAVPLDVLSRHQDGDSWMGDSKKVIDFHFVQLFLIVRMGVMTPRIFRCWR